ncbi:MAG: hypothetical protein AB8I08_27440 [Sandaracinaceae bacterium]
MRNDPLDDALRRLPPPPMPSQQRERVRSRARRALSEPRRKRSRLFRSAIEPALLATVCAVQFAWLYATVSALLIP